MNIVKIIDTNEENILNYGVCGYKNLKKPGYPEKIEWIKAQYKNGLKIKIVLAEDGTNQGMIEYIPGEYCWRPVEAKGYLFIHCLFVGFKKIYKNRGYASSLIEECINDARTNKQKGVVVVTRKSSFMVGNNIFLKHGFKLVDTAKPDFELMVKFFESQSPAPYFKPHLKEKNKNYFNGLTIIRANQCPYTVKNVNEIIETAKNEYGINPQLIDLKNYEEAQNSPCAFGTFCILYNGEILSYHPISNGRFINMMNKLLK